MTQLKEKYTDIKNHTHRVEHLLSPAQEENRRERIVQELLLALTKPPKSPKA